ncbi:alpha/beta fold hydrolase [Desulfurobacterium sp.]
MVYTIHGWSFNKDVWVKTPFANASHLELPGHGNSLLQITDILEVAREFGKNMENGSTIVGWSMGASIAVLIATSFPEKIEKLVLYSPTPLFCGLSQSEIICKRFLKKLNRNFEATVNWFRRECGFSGIYPLPCKDKAIGLLESYMELDLRNVLPNISVKTDIFVGLKDEVTKLSGAFSCFSLLPFSSIKIYPDKFHFLF